MERETFTQHAHNVCFTIARKFRNLKVFPICGTHACVCIPLSLSALSIPLSLSLSCWHLMRPSFTHWHSCISQLANSFFVQPDTRIQPVVSIHDNICTHIVIVYYANFTGEALLEGAAAARTATTGSHMH